MHDAVYTDANLLMSYESPNILYEHTNCQKPCNYLEFPVQKNQFATTLENTSHNMEFLLYIKVLFAHTLSLRLKFTGLEVGTHDQ